ncbi:MAG: hypothetical protein P4L22_01165 [Candidatus Babeliales bacterium]|nr:hypothetical protein [Candidatus Babeliales bacterium]
MRLRFAILLLTIISNCYSAGEQPAVSIIKFYFDTNEKRSHFVNAIAPKMETLRINAFSKTTINQLYVLTISLIDPQTHSEFEALLDANIDVNLLNSRLEELSNQEQE